MMSNLFKASLKVTNIVVLTSTKRNPAKGSTCCNVVFPRNPKFETARANQKP